MDRDKLYHFKSAMHLALRDIADYLYAEYPDLKNNHADRYVVTPHYLMNKEIRRLNRDLGLHKVNKSW